MPKVGAVVSLSSQLDLTIESSRLVKVEVSIQLNETPRLPTLVILVPFVVDSALDCPTQHAICSIDFAENDFSAFVVAPLEPRIIIETTSTSIIKSGPNQTNEIAMNFTYSSNTHLQDLLGYNTTIASFALVSITFPDYVDQSRVADTPSPSVPVSGRTRTYFGSNIMTSGNRLQLIFPPEVSASITIPIITAVVGAFALIPTIAFQENLKRRKGVLWYSVASFIVSSTLSVPYLMGPLPYNDYLPVLILILGYGVGYLWVYLRKPAVPMVPATQQDTG